MPFGELSEAGEGVKFKPVVGFKDADVATAGELDALVHTVTIAGIGLIKEAKTGVGGLVGFDDGEGVVGGAVVDAENLKVAKGLVGEGVKGLTEVGRGVVDGNEDGEKGGRWRLSSRLGIKLVHLGLLYHMVKAGRKEGVRCYNWGKRVKEEPCDYEFRT